MTPAGRHALTYDEESWKPTPEEASKSKEGLNEGSCTLERHQSRTKRVRNYLKKCKNALSNRSTNSDCNQNSDGSTSSWYVEKQVNVSVHDYQIVELEDVFENVQVVDIGLEDIREVANVVEVKGRAETTNEACENKRADCQKEESSPILSQVQDEVEEIAIKSEEVANVSLLDEVEKRISILQEETLPCTVITEESCIEVVRKEEEEIKVSGSR